MGRARKEGEKYLDKVFSQSAPKKSLWEEVTSKMLGKGPVNNTQIVYDKGPKHRPYEHGKIFLTDSRDLTEREAEALPGTEKLWTNALHSKPKIIQE